MQSNSYKLIVIILAILTTIPCLAQDNDPNKDKTVELVYPNLAAGVLTYAKVRPMPEGILLQSEGIEISSADIEKTISSFSCMLSSR